MNIPFKLDRKYTRGIGWLLIAIVGAVLLSNVGDWGVSEYVARWLGGLFKIASVVFGGYRVTRDVLRMDPSIAQEDPLAYAVMHLGRCVLIGAFAIAVCVAV